MFDSYGWSWTYWVWEPGYAESEAGTTLTRPRPLAFAGTAESWRVDDDGFSVSWVGDVEEKPSLFFVPLAGSVTVMRDGTAVAVERVGDFVWVAAATGHFTLSAER